MEFLAKSKKYGDKLVLIDDEDYSIVSLYKWNISNCSGLFYVVSSHYGRAVKLHRLVLKINDSKLMIDHINGNCLDNRKQNLRMATKSENGRNAKKRFGTSSKYKGVYFDKRRGTWAAQIHNGKNKIFLGYHKTEEDAAKAYNREAGLEFGEFARFNKFN